MAQNGKTAQQLQQEADAAALALAQLQGSAPGQYSSAYAAQISALSQQIASRTPFSYDANGDPLYRQYSEQYQRQGQRAMEDTLGTATGLTGGYGNSYATTASSQAYQQYLSELSDVLPTLYEAAYGRYQDAGSALESQLGALRDQDASAYSAYRDQVGDYQTALGDAQSYWRYLSDAAYRAQQDELAQDNWEREFAAKHTPAVSRSSGGTQRSGSNGSPAATASASVSKGTSSTKKGKARVLHGSSSTSQSLRMLREMAK